LTSVFKGGFKDHFRQLTIGFLRRAHQAFVDYHDARERTTEYLAQRNPDNPNLNTYLAALNKWENFALQVQMVYELFNGFGVDQAFKKNDGSKEQQIYELANQVKHFASCISSKQASVNDVTPLWLTNDGLTSFGLKVSYDEAAEILSDIAKFADDLQYPRSFVDRLCGNSDG